MVGAMTKLAKTEVVEILAIDSIVAGGLKSDIHTVLLTLS